MSSIDPSFLSIPEMHKKEVMEVLKEAAKKEETLKTKMSHMRDKKSMQEMSTIIDSVCFDSKRLLHQINMFLTNDC
jgi:hypothetical protein